MADEVTERIRILLELQSEAHDRALKKSAREIAHLEKSYDPLSRATIRHQQETEKLNRALERGTITQERHRQLMDRVQSEYDQTTAKIIRQNAALAANSQAGGGVIGVMNRNKTAVQQLGYQVGDFAVQVGNGTSALTAFAQQGSQVLGFLGPWGALAGAAVAIGAPLAAAFMNAGDEAEEAGKAIENLSGAVSDFQSAAELSMRSIEELTEEFGDQAEAIRETLDLMARLQLQNAVTAVTAAAKEAAVGLEDVRDIIADIDAGGRRGRGAEQRFKAFGDELGLTVEQARALVEALDALGAAEGPDQATRAARELQELLLDIYGSAERIPEAFRETALAAGKVDVEASKLLATSDDISSTWSDLPDIASSFADQIARALGIAEGLDGLTFGNLKRAAGDAFSAAGAWLQGTDGMQAAVDLIRSKEGMRNTPYWDVDAWRAGYGSDTWTDESGTARPVQQGSFVTDEQAMRDLARRIGEYFQTISKQIGSDAFFNLSAPQQASLASLLHNYGAGEFRQGGDLGGVLSALTTGNNDLVSQRIAELGAGGHEGTQTGEVLKARRIEEARAFGDPASVIAAQTAAEKAATEAKRETTKAEREKEQATKRSQSAIDALRGSTGDAAAAEFKHAEALKVVEEALKRNQITEEEAAELRERLAAELEKTLERIGEQAKKDSPFKQLQDDVESLTESLLRTAAAGGDVGEALKRFLLDAAIRAAAENLASAISNIFEGAAGGGGGGGFFAFIGNLLGGKKANGGAVQGGVPYLVNENTPNSEIFVPSKSGAILNVSQAQAALKGAAQPAAAGGGVLTGEIGVTVDDDGKLQAYVKRMGVQAATAGASQAVSTVKSNLKSWNGQASIYGRPK